jgi:hypothetical protein
LGSLGSVRGALSNGRPYRDLPTIDDLGGGVVNGRLEPVGVGVHGVLHLCEESSDLVEESDDLFGLVVRHGPIFSHSGASLKFEACCLALF